MSDTNLMGAKENYDLICKMLDGKNWHYEKFEDDLRVISMVQGDDLPISFSMMVYPEIELVSLVSQMPFKTSEDKLMDMALAVCMANYGLLDGSFDYDLSDGSIFFRLTTCYKGCTLSEELFEHMLILALSIVDKYNDKFFMLSKGMLTIQQFLESEQS